MQKIGNVTQTADQNGEFTNGNVAQGVTPTILLAEIFNTWQRELVNVVEGAGMDLDPRDDGQILKAINKFVGSGRLLNIQTFTVSSTYTPTIGTKRIRIKIWGAGGAGGGTQAVTVTQAAVGGGGTAGAYTESFINVTGPLPVTIGQAGVGAIAIDGTNGGASSVGSISAPGGVGGAFGVSNSVFPFGAQPRNPNVGTTGNVINTPGATASTGFTWSADGAIRSMGGQSSVGASQYFSSSVGYAAGGSGAIAAGGAGAVAALAGYNGAPGLVIIEEYA